MMNGNCALRESEFQSSTSAGESEVTALNHVELEQRVAIFREVAEQRRTQLLRLARRITNSSEDSEDILQDAFLRAYQALPRFRGEALMSTWLSVIVQNTAKEYLRGRKRRSVLSIEFSPNDGLEKIVQDVPDVRETPEDEIIRREMEQTLRSEIGKLSLLCRRALELCILEERSHIAAARELNVRVGTIKARVFRGKSVLRRVATLRVSKEETAGVRETRNVERPPTRNT